MFWCALPARPGTLTDQVIGAQVGQHGHLHIQQRHVHMLALAGALGMAQRRQNAHGGVHAGEQVGHRHAHLLRATAQVVALAGDAHQPANALHRIVVTGAVLVGAGLAKAGDAAVDQFGVDGREAGVVQAIARHVAHLEVLDEHIAVFDQIADQLLALGLGNVAGQRTLVAVGAQVIRRLGRVMAFAVFQKGRAPAARVVARPRSFDLDHVSPQIGQVLGTPRTGQHARQVKDSDAI